MYTPDCTSGYAATELAPCHHLSLFRAIVANMKAAVLVTNRDLEIYAANETFLTMFGIEGPVDGVIGRDLLAGIRTWGIAGTDPEALCTRAISMVRRNEPIAAERVTLGDGRMFEVDFTPVQASEGALLAYMWQFRDVTRARLAETALRESEERYRELFESDASCNFISTPDGNLVACNAAFARLFGFASVEHALRAAPASFYENPATRLVLIDRVRNEKRVRNFESAGVRRDGTALRLVEHVVGVFDAYGELTMLKGFVFDDTERTMLEEQLRHAQKMEAVGRLAGGVAHDFNNLLTIISGSSELALLEIAPDDPLTEYLVDIAEAAERGGNLTRQLLAFSRRQLVEPRDVDLGALLTDTEKMLRRLIGEDIQLCIDVANQLDHVLVDPGQIEQVVVNLATNARDAMPDGGTLRIRATNVEVAERATDLHAGVPPGSYVLLTVADTGTGMDSATRAHMFEPFFTTKENGRGTGLGLAITYGILSRSKGHIRVHSEPGCGSTFRVYLPLAKGSIERPEKSSRRRSAVPGGSETVLLVEDEEIVRKLVSAMLRTSGYVVHEAPDGHSAVEFAEAHEGPIHALVTDVVMPKMSGVELAQRIAQIRPDIRVLHMSGYAQIVLERQGIAGSDIAYIQKPFTPADLAAKMRDVLG
jgi:two-component system, cell cycle sensor histidine kinase and response regulator CckA